LSESKLLKPKFPKAQVSAAADAASPLSELALVVIEQFRGEFGHFLARAFGLGVGIRMPESKARMTFSTIACMAISIRLETLLRRESSNHQSCHGASRFNPGLFTLERTGDGLSPP